MNSPLSHLNLPSASFVLAALVCGLMLAATRPAVAQFDPSDLEWIDKEDTTLGFAWKMPKHPKWYDKERLEVSEPPKGRVLMDVIQRAESPGGTPDMRMRITAWSHGGAYDPVDYPSKSDDELKSILSKDPVLKQPQHKSFGTDIIKMQADIDKDGRKKNNQRAILDRLQDYKKSAKIKRFGKALDTIVKLHKKKKYIHAVPLIHGSSGELAKYYHAAANFELDRAKISKMGKAKIGSKPFSAKTFTAKGLHHRLQSKVMLEYFVFTGITGQTVAVEIIYWGGREKDAEIKYIKGKILDSFDKK